MCMPIRMNLCKERVNATYPACVWVQESPPYAICSDCIHATTPVQEYSEHAFSKIDNLVVLLGTRRICGVIGHSVLLRDRGDDQGGM